MQEKRIEILQRMPIFGGIRAEVLQFLLSQLTSVFVPHGEFFFRENDKADSMFVLETGKVSVLKGWEGKHYLLCNLEKGDCFGEMALMDFSPRSASVLALEDSLALEISVGDLFKLYQKDLEQFTMIQMNMGREVSRRLRETDEQLFRTRIGVSTANDDRIFRLVENLKIGRG